MRQTQRNPRLWTVKIYLYLGEQHGRNEEKLEGSMRVSKMARKLVLERNSNCLNSTEINSRPLYTVPLETCTKLTVIGLMLVIPSHGVNDAQITSTELDRMMCQAAKRC